MTIAADANCEDWEFQKAFNREVKATVTVGGGTGSTTVNKTLITFIGKTAIDTVIDLSASGVTWTKSGDTANIGVNAAAFNSSKSIIVKSNGREIEKPSEAEWASSTSLKLKRVYDTGETIVIES